MLTAFIDLKVEPVAVRIIGDYVLYHIRTFDNRSLIVGVVRMLPVAPVFRCLNLILRSLITKLIQEFQKLKW